MYETVLFIHDLCRWAILLTLIAAAGRALRGGEYNAIDGRLGLLLTIAIDTQVLLGLTLYTVLSPLVHAAFSDMGQAMHDPALRFYAVEHAFAMLTALVAVHVGRVRIRRASDAGEKMKRARRWYVAALVAVIVGMPWPGLPYGRSLLPHL